MTAARPGSHAAAGQVRRLPSLLLLLLLPAMPSSSSAAAGTNNVCVGTLRVANRVGRPAGPVSERRGEGAGPDGTSVVTATTAAAAGAAASVHRTVTVAAAAIQRDRRVGRVLAHRDCPACLRRSNDHGGVVHSRSTSLR